MLQTAGLADTMRTLREQGYIVDFNRLQKKEENIAQWGDDLVIDKVYRFDEMTDPGDQSVLYAIHSTKTGVKGILVNGFGLYTDPDTNDFLKKLHRWESEAH